MNTNPTNPNPTCNRIIKAAFKKFVDILDTKSDYYILKYYIDE